jgi:hypothetical protein
MVYVDKNGTEWSSYEVYHAATKGRQDAIIERQQQTPKPGLMSKIGDYTKKEYQNWRTREHERSEARHKGQLRGLQERSYHESRGYPPKAQIHAQRARYAQPRREAYQPPQKPTNVLDSINSYESRILGRKPKRK